MNLGYSLHIILSFSSNLNLYIGVSTMYDVHITYHKRIFFFLLPLPTTDTRKVLGMESKILIFLSVLVI